MPTYNERGNVETLVRRLTAALETVDWRVVFVDDDSPDGTAELVKTIARENPRVSCLRRVGRRGLAGAVIEGMLASTSPFVAVIDGDLQHDETLLPAMLSTVEGGAADIVVGTRFSGGGEAERGLSPVRRLGSRAANWAARRALKVQISDPMSGFFMLRREKVEGVAARLSTEGFKILFDIVAAQRAPLRVVELPYAFGERLSGASKMDGRVVADYLALLAHRLSGGLIPREALTVAVLFASSALVELSALSLPIGGRSVLAALLLAAFAVELVNAGANRLILGGRGRLRPTRFASGGVSVLFNVAVAALAFDLGASWWVAGLGGAAAGALWTYVAGRR